MRLAFRRSLAIRGLLAVVALGVFVAATLLASAPIYSRAMADLGLTFKVRRELHQGAGTQVILNDVPLQTEAGQAVRQAVEQRINERIGWFRAAQSRYIQLGRFGLARPGDTATTGLFQARPQSLTGYSAHVRIVQGQLPQPSAKGDPIQLAISTQSAAASRFKVGEPLELRESFDTCVRILPTSEPPPPPPPCDPTANASFSIPAVIVGIIEPADPADPFWGRPAELYFSPFRLDIPDVGPILPAFTDERTLTGNFGAAFPGYHASVSWWVDANPEKLNRNNFTIARSDIEALGKDVEPMNGTAFSPLRDTLQRYGTNADYAEVPLTVLLLEITGIALFYVGIVSAIVVEQQAADIALLRGRGASVMQVAIIYLWQGLIIGLPAAILAPFLAAGSTAILGLTPVFRDVSGGSLIPVIIPPMSFAAAAAGVGLSLAALVIPAVVVARRGVVSTRRSESRPGRSVIHRYYLDLALAAAAGVALFELRQRGSVYEPSSTAGLSSDPLLLASPALVMAAAAALVLRFYPIFLRMIAKGVDAAAGASVSLGLVQVVRNSAQYTRLTLLVMMAVAVGSFAASYAKTTDASYRDRSGFDTGADLRLLAPGGRTLPEPPETEKKLKAIPGVSGATAITRTTAGVAVPGVVSRSFQVLAADPAAISNIIYWRGDFASEPLGDLLARLSAPVAIPGTILPQGTNQLSVWFKGDSALSEIGIWAHLRDGSGRLFTVQLGTADTGGAWSRRTAPLASDLGGPRPEPVSLVSLIFTLPPNRPLANYPPLFVDDIGATLADGSAVVVEDFETGMRWSPFPSRAQKPDTLAAAADVPHGGKAAAMFTFGSGNTGETRGMYTTPQIVPLSVLASRTFLASTGLRPGGTTMLVVGRGTLVPIRVVASFDLFPTLATKDGPAVIFNRDQLTTWGDTTGFSDPNDLVPTEAFISLAPGADEAAVSKQIIEAFDDTAYGLPHLVSRSEDLNDNLKNPLIAAAGSGILFVSFAAVLALVAAGLLVSLVTSINRRRVEFAVVCAMGVSRTQVFRMLALEYAVVSIAGTLAGAILGVIVGRQMLSFLDVTETGAKVEPGFILQTEWLIVGGAIAAVLAVVVIGLVAATRAVSAQAGAQALRTE